MSGNEKTTSINKDYKPTGSNLIVDNIASLVTMGCFMHSVALLAHTTAIEKNYVNLAIEASKCASLSLLGEYYAKHWSNNLEEIY